MKYTDGLFTFPIRIYDGKSIADMEKESDILGKVSDIETKWVKGFGEIPFNEVNGIFDFFSRGRTIEEVAEEGFDGCYIITKTLGHFICTWTRERFKQELNKFVVQYEKDVEVYVNTVQDNKAKQVLAQLKFEDIELPKESKKSWWQKFLGK